MVSALVAAVIGFASGVASGAFGIGGAVLSTPAIRVLLGTSAIVAVGTTLPVIVPTAITGVLTYKAGGFIQTKLAVTAAAAGVGFSVLGALATEAVRGEWLLVITSVLIMFLAIRMLPTKSSLRPPTVRAGIPLFLVVGAVSGFVSGLLGVGGGLILVPIFTAVLRLPIKTALGTSLAVVAAQSIPGTIVHALLGHIDWTIAAGLALGVVPGARIGSKLAVRAQDDTLRIVVAVGMAVLAVAFGASELRRLV